MQIQHIVVPIIIEEFTKIYESTIEEEETGECDIDYRELRFNLAKTLLELYSKIGKLPFNNYLN